MRVSVGVCADGILELLWSKLQSLKHAGAVELQRKQAGYVYVTRSTRADGAETRERESGGANTHNRSTPTPGKTDRSDQTAAGASPKPQRQNRGSRERHQRSSRPYRPIVSDLCPEARLHIVNHQLLPARSSACSCLWFKLRLNWSSLY